MNALSNKKPFIFVGVYAGLCYNKPCFYFGDCSRGYTLFQERISGCLYSLHKRRNPRVQAHPNQALHHRKALQKPKALSLTMMTMMTDDDDEDTQPVKAAPTAQPKPSPAATVPQSPSPAAPSAFPAQVPPKPSTPPTVQAPAVKPVPSNEQPPKTLPQPAQQLAKPQPVPSRPAPARGSISLNFDDADVYQVIQTIFGDVLRVNYIVDPRVKGRVTFRSIAPIPTDQVLPIMETILRINGIGVVEDVWSLSNRANKRSRP